MALKETHFQFENQTSFYRGKVRDVYQVKNFFVSIASDRISAFDHILPKAIPHKGQVLNQLAVYFLEATKDIVPNWLLAAPDPNVSIGIACEPIRLEMVIRGYLVGHAWREYKAGKRSICGVPMKDGMRENEKFDQSIITPATKADEGHDEDISREEILSRGIVSEDIYRQLEEYTYQLFERGQEMASKRGLILVDTKYEFGIHNGEIRLIDEIHTPDSSRYFYNANYEELLAKNLPQEQLSKEFVREWLMEHGFQGKDGQTMPEMPDEFVSTISERYVRLYEIVTGEKFNYSDTADIVERIQANINQYLESSK